MPKPTLELFSRNYNRGGDVIEDMIVQEKGPSTFAIYRTGCQRIPVAVLSSFDDVARVARVLNRNTRPQR